MGKHGRAGATGAACAGLLNWTIVVPESCDNIGVYTAKYKPCCVFMVCNSCVKLVCIRIYRCSVAVCKVGVK